MLAFGIVLVEGESVKEFGRVARGGELNERFLAPDIGESCDAYDCEGEHSCGD